MPKKFIPYSTQLIDSDDIKAVVATLKSDFLTQGPKVNEFERKIAEYCGTKYAVAFNSGTSALHGACFAAGISNGDEVITSPITFVASSNCVLYCGGKPVFADIDPETALISIKNLKDKITPKTKAIIPVDYSGHPCDMDEINKIAKENNLIVIEDAAHSIGALYKGKKVGTLADMTMLSFHAVKQITTGEGGIILTDNKAYFDKLVKFRTHGITREIKDVDPWYYEMQTLGFNYRITDFQCALGITQLKKLDKFIKIRRKIAFVYNKAFANIKEITCPPEIKNVISSYHLYPIRLHESLVDKKRQIFDELRSLGVGVNVHYIPVPLQPYYQEMFGYQKGDFPAAEAFYESEISLPIHQKMTNADIQYVIRSVKSVIKAQSGR